MCFMGYLGFSVYKIILLANKHNFVFSLPIWKFLLFHSCLISVARTSRAKINKSSESKHPSLVLDFRENLSVLCHLVYWL